MRQHERTTGAERPSAREEDIAIRCAMLACAEKHGAVGTNEPSRAATFSTGVRVSMRSAANMAATLHRAGFLRWTDAEGLGYSRTGKNYHAITPEGRAVLRYFDPSRAR